MKSLFARTAFGCAAVLLIFRADGAGSAELKVMSAEALKTAMTDIVLDFEHTSGSKVATVYATAGVLKKRILGGESADVAIVPRPEFIFLVDNGRIFGSSGVNLAQSPLGIAVRASAHKPDISTIDALRRALLAAKSITYPDPAKGGGIGLRAARLIEHLGLTDQLKPKTLLTVAGEFRALVANGDAELAIVPPSVVMNYPGIDVVGTVPAGLEDAKQFGFLAGIMEGTQNQTVGSAFVRYLRSPPAIRVLESRGWQPG